MCHIYIVTCRHTSVFSLKTPHMLSQLTVNSCNFHSYATVPLHTWPQCCSLSKENQLSDSDYFIFQMVQTTSELPSCGFSDLKRRNNLVTLDRGAPGRGRALSDRFHTFTCCCEQWLWSPPVVLPQAKVLLSVFIPDKEFPAYCQQPFYSLHWPHAKWNNVNDIYLQVFVVHITGKSWYMMVWWQSSLASLAMWYFSSIAL